MSLFCYIIKDNSAVTQCGDGNVDVEEKVLFIYLIN